MNGETKFVLFVTDDTLIVGVWGVVSKFAVDTRSGVVFSGLVVSLEKVIEEDAKLLVSVEAIDDDKDDNLLVTGCLGE